MLVALNSLSRHNFLKYLFEDALKLELGKLPFAEIQRILLNFIPELIFNLLSHHLTSDNLFSDISTIILI